MNQLTTTTNQFTLEESLMEKVLEASGYQFTIVTPNDSEPHFIAKEVAEGLGYARNDYLTEPIQNSGLPLLKLTKENGLTDFKSVSPKISKNTRSLMLIPASSLQEFLLRHSTLPKGKELGDKLYKVFASGNPIFNEETLDDWGTSIEELQKTSPQLFDASKRVNGFIFGLVGNRELANELKSWITFLLSFREKSVQIQFSTETRFYKFTLFGCSALTCKLPGYNDIMLVSK